MITLQDAVDQLYSIAVVQGSSQSPNRLALLADLCVQELESRGLPAAETEVIVPGIGRNKKWDVAWRYDGKVRLGLSLKSLLRNLPGTVPNRVDDLMGEMANVQLQAPEIVAGYIMIFNVNPELDTIRRVDGIRWSEFFRSIISRLSGREAPAWAAGMVEAATMVEVDFSTGPILVSPPQLDEFFDRIAKLVKDRNPGAFALS